MEKVVVGLCAGRHDIPVDRYIFYGPINHTDIFRINQMAADWVEKNVPYRAEWCKGGEQVCLCIGDPQVDALLKLLSGECDLCAHFDDCTRDHYSYFGCSEWEWLGIKED